MTQHQIILSTINEHQPLKNMQLIQKIGSQIENKASILAGVSALRKKGFIETNQHGYHSITSDGELELVLPADPNSITAEDIKNPTEQEYGYNTIETDDTALQDSLHDMDLTNREGLPDELVKELAGSMKGEVEIMLMGLIKERGQAMSIDDFLVAAYRKHGLVRTRKSTAASLLNLKRKGLIVCPKNNGVYQLPE